MARNDGCTYREQPGPNAAGQTVLAYLAAAHRHSSRGQWADRLRRGELELNGIRAASDMVLRAGQVLVWHRPPWDEPDVPLHYDVLHEDEAVVAVTKPRGLPTMPAGGFLTHTLLALVRAQYKDARPMHRLGRHTSGIVLFARTHAAAASLGAAWRQQAVMKEYRTLARGVAVAARLEIDAPIGPMPHPILGFVHAASASGKPSRSIAVVLERRGLSTLFHVQILTGRPHQIRIHLAHAGFPLVGDPLYEVGGVARERDPGLPGDGGYLLHAERLRFVHPDSGAELDLHSAPPPELCGGQRLD
jgi:23S rRNA pseudouridine1911/1915/1917 synthase